MYDKVGVCLICMPYMHALYVCLICKHNGNNLLQVGVCLICMPCMYALDTCGRVSGSSLGRVPPYMYALYVCLICMPYMYALYTGGRVPGRCLGRMLACVVSRGVLTGYVGLP